jgi:hypothetical protein
MSSPAASSPAPSAKLPHEVRARPWYRRRRWVVLMAALALACLLALVLPLALILPNRGDGAPQANGPRVRLGSNNATYVASNAYGFDEWKGEWPSVASAVEREAELDRRPRVAEARL